MWQTASAHEYTLQCVHFFYWLYEVLRWAGVVCVFDVAFVVGIVAAM